jgi:uncharacterized protein YuzE
MAGVKFDPEADVLYVRLTDGASIRQKSLGDLRIIDYSAEGAVLGVEFIGASEGVELRDVPFAETIQELIAQSGLAIPVFV